MIAGRIDRDVGEHLRLQRAVLVVDGGADEQPPRRRIDRRGDVIDPRRKRTARQRQHIEGHVLSDRDVRAIAFADEGRHPDGGEIADHVDGIASAGVDILAGADLALDYGAGERCEDGDLRIDAALFLEGRDVFIGEAENAQLVACGFHRRLRRAQVVLRLDQRRLALLVVLERNGLAFEQILGTRSL